MNKFTATMVAALDTIVSTGEKPIISTVFVKYSQNDYIDGVNSENDS